jgi:hypothetical protein
MKTRTKTSAAALASLTALVTASAVAHANNQIVLETVSDYTYFANGSTKFNTDANTEGQGFWTPMTAPGSLWSPGVWFADFRVLDTDFYDPDLTGNPVDDDTDNFDPPTAALSFVLAHGQCDDVTDVPCRINADCGATNYCPNFPLGDDALPGPTCINSSPRQILTSSPNSSHGNRVFYGDGALSLALGEDPSSGPFDHAGLNGGTNVVIVTNSCGFRSRYFIFGNRDDNSLFGGAHEIMVNIPVGDVYSSSGSPGFADTAQWSARGATLANLILSNVNAPAMNAWLAPSIVENSFTAQGGRDVNAGVNAVKAKDVSEALAKARLVNETWAETLDESLDPQSNSGGAYSFYSCNFTNCSDYTL